MTFEEIDINDRFVWRDCLWRKIAKRRAVLVTDVPTARVSRQAFDPDQKVRPVVRLR